jgi:ribonucleoside-diphosphate reductase alpha chain
MEPWHYNIEDFLELKETNGSEYLRTRSLNTALWIPDEFMRRVDADQDWYLFDPAEIPALAETRGAEFERAYQDAIDRANTGKIKLFKKMKARDLYRECLQKLAKTGNYRFNFKDRHNEANQAPNYSMIHSSNLCTEISIPNREDSTAVCTLASLNLVKFIKTHIIAQTENFAQLPVTEKLQAIDRADMGHVISTAIHALDNILEVNFYPSVESEKNSLDLRPLGL